MVLLASLLAFVLRGADQPKGPYLLPPGVTTPPRSASVATVVPASLVPGGLPFGQTALSVTLPSGQVLHWCVWVAETDSQREEGLMNLTDPGLGGRDGMLFRFPSDTEAAFYMKDTPQPLTIAFIDAGGHVVLRTDMPPCLDQTTCPTYAPSVPYRLALEVPQGKMDGLGIGEGSRVGDDHRSCSS